jgi:3-deoxy-D-manno-octulosonic-acid transferase
MKRYHPFWFFIYNGLVIPSLFVGMHLARIFNHKVRDGIRGRRGLFRRLKEARAALESGRRFIVIHCTSAGELEAARPILERLKLRLPQYRAHVTCYSPSGMRSLEKSREIESYSYLPFDDLNSARRFFGILEPAAFLIVKHDVWPNMVCIAAEKGIPVLWINANLHSKTKRTKWLFRGLNRSFLRQLDRILTVGDDHALRLVRLVSPQKIEVVGDSRYDRTLARMSSVDRTPLEPIPDNWFSDKKVLLGGSTWGPDQRILIPAFAALKRDYSELHLILVPHEPKAKFLDDTRFYLENFGLQYSLYSQLNGNLLEADILIVDKVGILAALYQTAWAAYVGGAFSGGVHSVLEPAAFNLPVFFGPRYHMAHEAGALIQSGGAWAVHSSAELEAHLRRLLENDGAREAAAQASGNLVRSGAGATDRIIDHLEKALRDRK